MRKLRVQVVVPVLPKLLAGPVALFVVLPVVVLTREATVYTRAGG